MPETSVDRYCQSGNWEEKIWAAEHVFGVFHPTIHTEFDQVTFNDEFCRLVTMGAYVGHLAASPVLSHEISHQVFSPDERRSHSLGFAATRVLYEA